jgi:hypothetical protein
MKFVSVLAFALLLIAGPVLAQQEGQINKIPAQNTNTATVGKTNPDLNATHYEQKNGSQFDLLNNITNKKKFKSFILQREKESKCGPQRLDTYCFAPNDDE